MRIRSRLALLIGLAAALAPLPWSGGAALGAGDASAPTVSTPVAFPEPWGTATTSGVELRVRWTTADSGGSGVARSILQVSVDGGSWASVRLSKPTVRHAVVRVRPPHDARFRVRAVDGAGNSSPWETSTTTAWRLPSQATDGVTTTGTWSTVSASGFLGGTALRTREAGATLSYAFTGSHVAWVGRTSIDGGLADVYADDVHVATVSTRTSGTADRVIVVGYTWATPGDHRLRIVTQGTAGHPDIVVDGFVVGDAPPADPVLVGAGDIAYCHSPADNRTADLLDAIPGRVFAAGDTAYPTGSAAQLRDCYGRSWGRWKLRTSPAVGNHEYLTAGADPYWDYFGDRAGARGKGWYAYDLGTWRVYTLNANCTEVGCGADSAQVRWLRADLAANPRECIAAVMHEPLFSSGEHGNDPSIRPLWDALHDFGAEVVLAGHDHDYERFAPQTPAGVASAGGIREFVVGTGGAPLRAFSTIRANSEVRDHGSHGVLKLTLRSGAYDWQFIPIAGDSFTDSGTTACH